VDHYEENRGQEDGVNDSKGRQVHSSNWCNWANMKCLDSPACSAFIYTIGISFGCGSSGLRGGKGGILNVSGVAVATNGRGFCDGGGSDKNAVMFCGGCGQASCVSCRMRLHSDITDFALDNVAQFLPLDAVVSYIFCLEGKAVRGRAVRTLKCPFLQSAPTPRRILV
jgi:hypothetical protein